MVLGPQVTLPLLLAVVVMRNGSSRKNAILNRGENPKVKPGELRVIEVKIGDVGVELARCM